MGWQPESLTAQIDGVKTLFDTFFQRVLTQLIVFHNGDRVAETDYSEPNNGQVLLGFAPDVGDELFVFYFTDETIDGRIVGFSQDPTAPPIEFPQGLQELLEDFDNRLDVLEAAGGGGILPPFSGINGFVLTEDDTAPLGMLWKPILAGDILPDFEAILTADQTIEVGDSLVDPEVSAAYNRPPVAAEIDDSEGTAGLPLDVLGAPNPITVPATYQKLVNNEQVTVTLTANEGGPADADVVTYRWQPRVYFGVGLPGLSTEADIEGLPSSALAASRQRTIVESPAAGEKIYYAYPAAYGLATFLVNGFEGGFTGPTVVSVTNAFGVTQDYNLYESAVAGLGATTVEVQ